MPENLYATSEYMIFVTTDKKNQNLSSLNEIKGGKWDLGTWISKPKQINLLFLLWLDPKSNNTHTKIPEQLQKSTARHKKQFFAFSTIFSPKIARTRSNKKVEKLKSPKKFKETSVRAGIF